MREERGLKERLFREKDALNAEKFAVEQKYKDLQVDLDLQTDKVRRLDEDLLEMTSSRPGSDQESTTLRRQKQDLERRVQEQEEELDEQAATIQQLEAVRCKSRSPYKRSLCLFLRLQAKLRLEMASENTRKKHAQELEEKELEVEETRSASQKKLKSLEAQLEEEYSEKQTTLRAKRELERKLSELQDAVPVANTGARALFSSICRFLFVFCI